MLGVAMLAFGFGALPNLRGIGLLWRQLDRLRRAGVPRVLAGGVVTLFGI